MTRETKVASIPDVRSDNVEEVLRAIKNVLQVREGHIGDPLDQNVTVRDLTDLKIVSGNGVTRLTGGTTIPVRNPVVQDDGYNPSTDFTSPPAPTGLTASPTFTNVYLVWNGAPYRNHAYTEIWRAGTNNLGNAVLVGRSNTSVYADAAQEGHTYYYWIRFVSGANVTGPYNSTDGTSATTATNPTTLLDLLTGQITASQLNNSLGSRIDLIDGPASAVGTVNARIAVVQSQVNDLLNTPAYNNSTSYPDGSVVTYNGGLYEALQNTLGNLPTDTTYWQKIGDYASLGDAVAAHTTQISSLQSGLGQEITDRTTLATQLRGGYTGNDINSLTSGLIYQERITRSSADSALSSSISALSSTVTNNYNTLNASISSEATTRASADSALSTSINVLTASFKATQLGLPLTQWVLNGQTLATVNDGKVGSSVLRLGNSANAFPNQGTYIAIDPTKKYRARFWARPSSNADGALYFSLRQFTDNAGTFGPINNGRSPYKPGPINRAAHNATYGADAWGEYSYIWSASDWQVGVKFFQPEFLNNFGGTAGYWEIQDFTLTDATETEAANAAIVSEASTRASADSALSTSISNVSARLNSGGDVYTSIVTAQNTASAKNASFVQSTTPIATKVGDLWVDTGNGNILKQWNGATWVTADDQRIGATATSVTQLQVRMNNATGFGPSLTMEQAFSAQASQITGLSGQYTVKIDYNGYVTGFGLASTAVDGTPTSSFVVRADSFSIANPSGPSIAPVTPFIVRTTSTTINGQAVSPGVYISDAFIQNGTITNAKIASLTADKITTGTLSATIGISTGKIYGGVNPNGSAIGSAGFGTGFLLGDYLGGNKFFIGSPANNLIWDGSSLTVRGVIYASAGLIGQNVIDANGISSPNYVTGSSGWSVNRDGNVEFNTGTFRGQINVKSSTSGERMEIRNSVIKIFDASGVVRVKIGDLDA